MQKLPCYFASLGREHIGVNVCNCVAIISIAGKCLRTLSGLFSLNLIDQSSSRILTTHAKTTPIVQDDWPIRLGENRPDRALKHTIICSTLIYL